MIAEEEIVAEWKKGHNSIGSNVMGNITIGKMIFLGVLFFIAIAITKNPQMDQRYNLVIYAVLVVIIIYLLFKPSQEQTMIPEHIAKRVGQAALERKRAEGVEISFDSKIYTMAACHLVSESSIMSPDAKPISWDMGFIEHVHGTTYTKEGVISIHPFEGYVIGIDWRKLGYDGNQSRDVKYIPVGIVQGNVNTTDLGGGNQSGK